MWLIGCDFEVDFFWQLIGPPISVVWGCEFFSERISIHDAMIRSVGGSSLTILGKTCVYVSNGMLETTTLPSVCMIFVSRIQLFFLRLSWPVLFKSSSHSMSFVQLHLGTNNKFSIQDLCPQYNRCCDRNTITYIEIHTSFYHKIHFCLQTIKVCLI